MHINGLMSFIRLMVRVRLHGVFELYQVLKRYGRYTRFMLPWCWLRLCYLLDSPYRCSRRYAKGQTNDSALLYGETPLTTLEGIMHTAGVTADDHVFEFGGGSGYTSLWLQGVLGCRVTAVELVPVFCWRLVRTAKRFGLNAVNVRCESFLLTDVKGATVIFLYGSALDEKSIHMLAEKIVACRRVKVISVSFSLGDYMPEGACQKQYKKKFSFDWGETDVFFLTFSNFLAGGESDPDRRAV